VDLLEKGKGKTNQGSPSPLIIGKEKGKYRCQTKENRKDQKKDPNLERLTQGRFCLPEDMLPSTTGEEKKKRTCARAVPKSGTGAGEKCSLKRWGDAQRLRQYEKPRGKLWGGFIGEEDFQRRQRSEDGSV